MKYLLFTWPWSQTVMDLDGAILVDPTTPDGDYNEELDSSYMVPVDSLPDETAPGDYVHYEFPESQSHMEDDGVIYDYDGGCFVPCD